MRMPARPRGEAASRNEDVGGQVGIWIYLAVLIGGNRNVQV